MGMCKFIVNFILIVPLLGHSFLLFADNKKDDCSNKDLATLSAEQTLACFLSLDAKGSRLSSRSEKFSPRELTNWEAEPGWDTLNVVDRYEFKSTPCSEIKESKACFSVNYFEWAEISSSFKLPSLPKQATLKSMNFELSQINKIWKIKNPGPFMPHVSVSAVLKHLELLANKLSKADKVKTYNAHEKIWKVIHKLETLRK